MKKIFAISGIALFVLAIAGVFVFHNMSAGAAASREDEVSPKAAKSLQQKIDAIKAAQDNPSHAAGSTRVDLSEAELESYVLFELTGDIPAHMDSFEVQLEPGTVAAHTQLTFPSNATGNSMIDVVLGGTHDLFVKGSLMGANGRGKFELLEIHVDGIPVPKVLVQTLFQKYVKPKYPDADLSEPFDIPWNIQEITITQGKATIAY